MPKSTQDHLTYKRAKSALRGGKSLVVFLTGIGPLSLDHLPVKLPDHPFDPTQLLDALLRGRIVLAHLSPLHPVFPDQKSLLLHLVQCRIQRTVAQGVAVALQFGEHPRSVEGSLRGVVEDVNPYGSQLQISEQHQSNRPPSRRLYYTPVVKTHDNA